MQVFSYLITEENVNHNRRGLNLKLKNLQCMICYINVFQGTNRYAGSNVQHLLRTNSLRHCT